MLALQTILRGWEEMLFLLGKAIQRVHFKQLFLMRELRQPDLSPLQ